jgi:acetyl esterase/lipase
MSTFCHQIFRVALCCCLLTLAGAPPSRAVAPERDAAETSLDPALGITTFPLYPGRAPGAKGDAPADVPTLTLFRPVHPSGSAVLVAPGGSYLMLAANHEGREPADRLAALGVTVFVLKYRLGPSYVYPVPLEDSRRAVRLVRSLASTYGYSPDRIGMMGFSAGGHLTAITGTLPEAGHPDDPDPVNRESSKLNFLILVYPWLNAMQPPVANPYSPGKFYINYCSVIRGLTQTDCARLDAQYTPLTRITAQSPPTFIVHTVDDDTVPVSTSVDFFTALHRDSADCELHLFAHGPHGFGPGMENATLAPWQDLLANWMRAHGWLTALPASSR